MVRVKVTPKAVAVKASAPARPGRLSSSSTGEKGREGARRAVGDKQSPTRSSLTSNVSRSSVDSRATGSLASSARSSRVSSRSPSASAGSSPSVSHPSSPRRREGRRSSSSPRGRTRRSSSPEPYYSSPGHQRRRDNAPASQRKQHQVVVSKDQQYPRRALPPPSPTSDRRRQHGSAATTAATSHRRRTVPSAAATTTTSPPPPKSSFAQHRRPSGRSSAALSDSRKPRKQPQHSVLPSATTRREQHKPVRRGVKALREIRKYQMSTENLIPRRPFQMLVREIARRYDTQDTSYKFTPDALAALQSMAEAFLVGLCEDSYLCSIHGTRVTLQPRDVHLTRRLRGRGGERV